MNKQKIARIISDIFIPLTFSTFMSIYIPSLASNNVANYLRGFTILFSSTVLIPLIYFLYKRRKGEIINRDATIKEERNDVYLFTIIIFSTAYILSLFSQSQIFVRIYLLNYSLSTIGVYFINKKIKISIHSMVAAGTSALLLFINPYLAYMIFSLTIVIMWSRVMLEVHTLKEVFYGMIYGFCVTLIVTIFVLKYAT